MKNTILSFLLIFASFIALAAPAKAPKYLGNYWTTDGSQNWIIGIYPEKNIAAYQNDFWDITATNTKSYTLTNRSTGERKEIPFSYLKTLAQTPTSDPTYKIPDSLNAPFSDNLLFDEPVVVRGIIIDYTPALGFATVEAYLNNIATRADSKAVSEITPQGTFTFTATLASPSQIGLSIGQTYTSLYACQGDTILLYINYNDLLENKQHKTEHPSTLYMGQNAPLNREIIAAEALLSPSDQVTIANLAAKLTPEQFKNQLLEQIKIDSLNIENFIATNPISQKGAYIIRNNHKITTLANIITYNDNRQMAQYILKDTTIKELPLPQNHFDIARQLPLNDPKIITLPYCDQLLQALYYRTPILSNMGSSINVLENAMKMLPNEEIQYINSLPKTNNAADIIDVIFERNPWIEDWLMMPEVINIMEKGNNFFGRSADFTTELILSRESSSMMRHQSEFTPNHILATLLCHFTNPYYITARLNTNDQFRPKPQNTEKYSPATKAEILLDSLIKPFRGKIVLLDFWGIGCGPCRSAMMDSHKTKAQLDGLPIVYAYVSSVGDTPKEAADKFFKDNNITGERFELPSAQWSLISAQWNITSIPHYMLIGKDGSILSPNFNDHDIAKLRKYAIQE